jgi:hypothetical protein
MSTRSISTSVAISICDVCGRTLLRGERAEVYVSGGARRSVCELCTSRALHGGWVREGTVPSYESSGARPDRRRSLLGRFRTRRDAGPGAESPVAQEPQRAQSPAPAWPDPPAHRSPSSRPLPGTREPRHVRAVPTSIENKISSAVSLFNASEHPRTVAGIARSLGLPEVSVLAAPALPSVVHVVVSWELCWYRYEVDLSDEVPTVRGSGQGYELDELAAAERQCNAVADDRGMLSFDR